MRYITILNQRRLGDFGIPDPKTNKINKTPDWVLQGVKKMKELKELKIVETEDFDTSKYIGMKTKIDLITIEDGKNGEYLKLKTLELDDDKVRASLVFGLKSVDGEISISKGGKLFEFMKSKKVDDYRKLKGVDVVVLSKTDKEGKDWLYFA